MAVQTNLKDEARLRRKRRVRKKISGSSARPRLSVFRSSKHLYAQVIDDATGRTLAAASTVDKEFDEAAGGTKAERARRVGQLIARRCLGAGMELVVFDRNGYAYQSGRVRAFAEGAREGGLKF